MTAAQPDSPTHRLSDEQLRSIASPDWVSYDQSAGEQPNHWAETARRLAAEVLELRQVVRETGPEFITLDELLARSNEGTTQEIIRIHRRLVDDARSRMTADNDADARANDLWLSGYSEGVEHGLETVRARIDRLIAINDVFDEIRAERATHTERGYDAEHDRQHGASHLVVLAGDYAVPAMDNRHDGRAQLVKCASLILAALEMLPRESEVPPHA